MATVEGNPALPDINDLNEAEKRHLLHVIKRAKDFEVIEGQLIDAGVLMLFNCCTLAYHLGKEVLVL